MGIALITGSGISVASLQWQNETIYGEQNRRNFGDPLRIHCRIGSHFGLAHKCVRKDKTENLPFYLCMSLSWSFALANNLGINLENELWNRFPGVCPYCGQIPCTESCHKTTRALERKDALLPSNSGSFRDLQEMLRRIYPHNTALTSAGHGLEEIAEVGQAIDHWTGTHKNEHFEKIALELADVITHICAVASCIEIDLTNEMGKTFEFGCCKCHKTPCICGFTTDPDSKIR